jgi:PRTRC genetic system protein A
MSLSLRDLAVQSALPALPVPLDSPLPPLLLGQRRLLLAADGLYLDLVAPTLSATLRLALTPLPFGPVQQQVSLHHGPLPAAHLRALAERASATPDREIAGAIVWTAGQGYRVVVPEILSASASHVSYRDTLDDTGLLLDVHSHGRGAAYFSPVDDASDNARPGPYLAAVLGRCDGAMELALRLVSPPFLVPLPVQLLSPAEHGLVAS